MLSCTDKIVFFNKFVIFVFLLPYFYFFIFFWCGESPKLSWLDLTVDFSRCWQCCWEVSYDVNLILAARQIVLMHTFRPSNHQTLVTLLTVILTWHVSQLRLQQRLAQTRVSATVLLLHAPQDSCQNVGGTASVSQKCLDLMEAQHISSWLSVTSIMHKASLHHHSNVQAQLRRSTQQNA